MNGQRMTLWLNFLSDDTGLKQLSEPVGFDAATFTVEQEKGRLGRDVTYGNKEVSLEFYKGAYEATEDANVILDGQTIYFKTHLLDFLLMYFNTFGSESKVEFIVNNNGTDFVTGLLDYPTCSTDDRTKFVCKVVQEPARMVYKRQAETKIDLNSTTDINGNTITPIEYENVLMLALPTKGVSKWKYAFIAPKTFTLADSHFNFSNQQVSYGIRSTLSYIQGAGEVLDFPYIEAGDELRDVVINFTNLNLIYGSLATGSARLHVRIYTQPDSNSLPFPPVNFVEETVHEIFAGVDAGFPSTLTFNYPLVLRGQRIGIYFFIDGIAEMIYTSMDVEITAIATAFPSVAAGVRHISIFDQLAKSINGFELHAPRWRTGGEFWGRIAISNWGMRGFTDKPFWANWKDETDDLSETNSDTQILPDKIFMGIEPDFYPDRELGNYPNLALESIERGYLQKALVKMVKFEFQNYAKDNLLAVHTLREFKSPNVMADNPLEIKVRHIVCDYRIEEIRKMNIIYDENESVGDDDNYCLVDTVPLPEGTEITQTGLLQQRVDPDSGFLQILNNTFSGYDAKSPTFGWNTLGTSVGDTFVIAAGVTNSGTYTIEELTQEVITLSGGTPSNPSDPEIITFTYPITTATLVKRTMEGFDSAVGVPEEMGNKAYTPTRLLYKYYGSLLKLIASNYPTGQYNEPYFKGNGDCIIQETGFDAIDETAPILVADLPDAILDQRNFKSDLVVDFDSFKSICDGYNTIWDDDTIGGWIGCNDANGQLVKVYLTKASEIWASSVLDFGEEVKA
jgi:hypothetical protein